jgi:hypothetical protein
MVMLTRQKTKAAKEYEKAYERQTVFYQEVLALATKDKNRAYYELWWTWAKERAPWVAEETTDKERRKAFGRYANFCLKNNKGATLTYAPHPQAILGEVRSMGS